MGRKKLAYLPCKKNFFVIQEHRAKRAGLHYDLRLTYKPTEKAQCRLFSLVSKKLPSFLKGEVKRIQMFPTDDHSLDYADFEGEIPSGYGEGVVKIWDRGEIEYTNIAPDRISFRAKGRKFRGHFTLIRLNGKSPNPYEGTWLLIKKKKP